MIKWSLKQSYLENIPELNDENDIFNDAGIQKAPEIIDLKNDAKFHDNDGNILEIKTRGSRIPKDIENGFNIKGLKNII